MNGLLLDLMRCQHTHMVLVVGCWTYYMAQGSLLSSGKPLYAWAGDTKTSITQEKNSIAINLLHAFYIHGEYNMHSVFSTHVKLGQAYPFLQGRITVRHLGSSDEG